jgi:hypothetical protein
MECTRIDYREINFSSNYFEQSVVAVLSCVMYQIKCKCTLYHCILVMQEEGTRGGGELVGGAEEGGGGAAEDTPRGEEADPG